ncbi:hypothetical protein IV102_21900 [bacterium]|nr:hypothetical protein [bacterium]
MKKLLVGFALTLGAQAWAAPDMVYHALPDPSYKLVNLGNRWVIQDQNGFFVGYYTPAPPPATYVPAPKQTAARTSPGFGGGSSGYSYGYNNFGNYGYNGYGYSGYGYNDYGNYSRSQRGHCPQNSNHRSAGYCSQPQSSQPHITFPPPTPYPRFGNL